MTWDVLFDQRPLSHISKTASPRDDTMAPFNAISAGGLVLGTGLGAAGASKAQNMLNAAGADADTRERAGAGMGTGALGGLGRQVGLGLSAGVLGGLAGGMRGGEAGTRLGAIGGALAGQAYGLYRGYRAPIERAESAIQEMRARQQKTAGLFMRPSDIADHRSLAAALEGKLNGSGQGTQFKLASAPPERMVKAAMLSRNQLVDGGIGALGGLLATNRLMSRTLSQPSPVPAPQEPQGITGRVRAAYDRRMDSASNTARTYPVTSYLIGATAGAVGGATSNARVYDRIKTILRTS